MDSCLPKCAQRRKREKNDGPLHWRASCVCLFVFRHGKHDLMSGKSIPTRPICLSSEHRREFRSSTNHNLRILMAPATNSDVSAHITRTKKENKNNAIAESHAEGDTKYRTNHTRVTYAYYIIAHQMTWRYSGDAQTTQPWMASNMMNATIHRNPPASSRCLHLFPRRDQ